LSGRATKEVELSVCLRTVSVTRGSFEALHIRLVDRDELTLSHKGLTDANPVLFGQVKNSAQ
jgi:hypothetical protein